MRKGCGCLLLLVLALVAFTIIAASVESHHQSGGAADQTTAPSVIAVTNTPIPSSNQNTAFKLSALEENAEPNSGDPLVGQMQSALDTLQSACGDSTSKLGDQAVTIHDDLKGHGIDESYLSILQQVDASIPSGSTLNGCAPIFAAYAVLRENG